MTGPGHALPPRETRLLQAARAGDSGAFALLVRESAPSLERLALRMLGHRQDAEDVAQDAVLTAYRQLGRFEGRSRFKTWICRILMRRAIDLLRRRRPAEPVADVAADDDPAARAEEAEQERLVRAAIDELPPVQRATILLRADQGLSYEEIAYVLGSTRNAVRMNLVAARKKLAALLDGKVDLR